MAIIDLQSAGAQSNAPQSWRNSDSAVARIGAGPRPGTSDLFTGSGLSTGADMPGCACADSDTPPPRTAMSVRAERAQASGRHMLGAIRRLLAGGEVRQLSKHCTRRLVDFPLPDPFTLDGLISNIEKVRDCSIQLVPVGSAATDLRTACGLRVRAGRVNVILYRPRPTPNQTLHTIFHELSHLWLDHGSDLSVPDGLGLPEIFEAFLAEQLGTETVHARAHYESRQEREAELTASLIRHLIHRQAVRGADLLSVMEASLTHPVAPPRLNRPL
ncbi:hypothetical protein ACT1U9_04130 [Streptomyces sp. BR1]|uniref:hypothetical protein n=1 Tax=Streptomyces sp. BR1 TaxID=1592323 RepID=UPI00402B0B06